MTEQLAREVRDFWLDPGRLTRSARSSAQTVRARFTGLLDQAAAGALSAWTNSPRRALSLVIVLDQFSRIIHQGTPKCYACDEQALAITLSGIQSGADATLTLIEQLYFCMPLQRAEFRRAHGPGQSRHHRPVRPLSPPQPGTRTHHHARGTGVAGGRAAAAGHAAIGSRADRTPARCASARTVRAPRACPPAAAPP